MDDIKMVMILVWDETLYSWNWNNEMAWVQHGIQMESGYKCWHEVWMHDYCYLVVWIYLVCVSA